MQVSAASLAISAARHVNHEKRVSQQPDPRLDPSQHNATSNGPVNAPEEGAEPRPHANGKAGRAHGVLRLLEEGHFKGVADVRLRINFHEELQKRSNDAAVERVAEGGAALVDDVVAAVTDPPGDEASTSNASALPDEMGEAVGAFQSAAKSAIEEAVSAGSVDIASFEATLRSAFDALVATLSPEVDETASASFNANPVPNESLQAPGEGVTAPVADLINMFESGLSSLLDQIAGASALPEPAPPHGNGVAYERFLAQYEQLTSVASGQVDVAA